jgi:plastocyanin
MGTKKSWTFMAALVAVELITWSCQRGGPPAPAPVASAVAAAGVPVSPTPPSKGGPDGAVSGSRVVVELTTEGFVPSHIPAQAGKPITLAVTRKTDKTCAHEILIKGQPGKTDLPLGKEVEVTFTPKASGAVPFGCAMGMMVGGVLEVR